MKRVRDAFDVKKEVFAVGKMSGDERNLLRERFMAELVAVRGLLQKADQFLALGVVDVEDCRGGDVDAPMEADDGKVAKRKKTSPVAEHKEAPKMTPAERQQLAFSLAALAAELSDHAVELLPKLLQGHDRRREVVPVVVDVCSMDDAALLELKIHVDKLVKTKDSSLPPHNENEECVELCAGVSAMVIAPSPLRLEILEYADVFNATGLVDKMLSPLPQKYLALAGKGEKEEYAAEIEEYEHDVDICGGASPVVIQNRIIGAISISSSSSDSDSDSSDSGGSDKNKHSDDEKLDTPPDVPKVRSPARAVLSKVIDDSAAPSSEPTLEVVQNAELKKLNSPAPAVLSKVIEDSAAPSEPALEVVLQNAEPENVSSQAPAEVLPKVNGDSGGQATVAQNVEPEKQVSKYPSPAVPYKVIHDDSAPSLEAGPENGETEKLSSPTPTPSVLLSNKVNGDSALQSKPAPEVVQKAEPEKLPYKAPPARSVSELVAEARREERSQAREKARQELAETERSAMASDRVHPVDMERLGIIDVEHMVSQEQRHHGAPPSLLQQLGLFLKVEDDGAEPQQQQPSFDPCLEELLEEGEIR